MATEPAHNTPTDAYAVLLAGGSGTRLWPVSREFFPKQLVKFIGDNSLVQNTIRRLLPVVAAERIRVVCGQEHYHETARHMEQIGLDPAGKILSEPCGRNTAPAILLAVLHICRERDDAVVCVFPADHVIRDLAEFQRRLTVAIAIARTGHIVTFGIQPHYPETGYGYIEGGERIDAGAFRLKRFVEKPDQQTAEAYIAAGNFFWNSGMFAFPAAVIRNEFKRHEPEMLRLLEGRLAAGQPLSKEFYRQLNNISIDYAIMEKTTRGVVLPVDFGWSDVGSWKSLYDFLPKDDNGNVIDGDVIARETKNSFIVGYERLIATNHLENVVIVETPDSIFASDLDHSRDAKSIVESLKSAGRKEYQHHRTRFFPWGRETLLEQRRGYRVRRFVVYPGAGFSPEQGGGSAAKHWCVVEGSGRLSFPDGSGDRRLARGDAVDLPPAAGVRIENPDPVPLHVIETETTEPA